MQTSHDGMPHVLIVDDERDLCEVVRNVARSCGYRSTIAVDARECFDSLGATRYTLIVVDLQLPGMDGVELLRKLADAGCTASIAIISGLDRRVLESAGRLAQWLKLDVVATLQKPILIEDLMAAMRTAAARQAAPASTKRPVAASARV